MRAFRLVAGTPEAVLERMARDAMRPDPMDMTFYADVDLPLRRTAETFATSIRLRNGASSAREQAAIASFAQEVDGCTPSRLLVYEVDSGFADAVGALMHGFALVDTVTMEALWFHVAEAWTT